MKNEDRILELLAETLQRIDRHAESIDRHAKIIEQHSETLKQHSETLEQHSKIIEQHSESMAFQLEALRATVVQSQKHQDRLEQHGDAISALRERTEVMHQTSLEQQKAYQAMTELLLHHNRALTAKGIL